MQRENRSFYKFSILSFYINEKEETYGSTEYSRGGGKNEQNEC